MSLKCSCNLICGKKKLLAKEESRFCFYKPIKYSHLWEQRLHFYYCTLNFWFRLYYQCQMAAKTLREQENKWIFLAICIHYIVTTPWHKAEVKAASLLSNCSFETPHPPSNWMHSLRGSWADTMSRSSHCASSLTSERWIFLKRQII